MQVSREHLKWQMPGGTVLSATLHILLTTCIEGKEEERLEVFLTRRPQLFVNVFVKRHKNIPAEICSEAHNGNGNYANVYL